MKNIKLILPCVLISATVASCMQAPKGQNNDPGTANKPIGTEVPIGFDWKTTEDITLSGNIDDQYAGRYQYRVNVYAENPVTDANAMLIKSVSTKSTVNIPLTIPKGVKTIYVTQIDPLSRRLVQAVSVEGNSANFDFTSNATPYSLKAKGERGRTAPSITIPSTPSDAIVLSGSSKIKLKTDANYVIPQGSTFGGDITLPGEGNVNIFVEGVWNIGKCNMTLQKDANIIIQSTGLIKGDEDV